MSSLSAVGTFLVDIIIDAYIYVLILRLILQHQGASWHNPFVQFVVKLTDVIVKPVRKILPGYRGIDFAIVFWIILFELVEIFLLSWIQFVLTPGILGAIIVAIAGIATKIVNVYFFTVIIAAILSWFPRAQQHPLSDVVIMIAEPLMNVARRFIPFIGGVDISPIVLIIIFQLISILVLSPLAAVGMKLAFVR